ncbi:hypothetical protein ACXIU3_24280, partial [Vibrio parahaemolyticus]
NKIKKIKPKVFIRLTPDNIKELIKIKELINNRFHYLEPDSLLVLSKRIINKNFNTLNKYEIPEILIDYLDEW